MFEIDNFDCFALLSLTAQRTLVIGASYDFRGSWF